MALLVLLDDRHLGSRIALAPLAIYCTLAEVNMAPLAGAAADKAVDVLLALMALVTVAFLWWRDRPPIGEILGQPAGWLLVLFTSGLVLAPFSLAPFVTVLRTTVAVALVAMAAMLGRRYGFLHTLAAAGLGATLLVLMGLAWELVGPGTPPVEQNGFILDSGFFGFGPPRWRHRHRQPVRPRGGNGGSGRSAATPVPDMGPLRMVVPGSGSRRALLRPEPDRHHHRRHLPPRGSRHVGPSGRDHNSRRAGRRRVPVADRLRADRHRQRHPQERWHRGTDNGDRSDRPVGCRVGAVVGPAPQRPGGVRHPHRHRSCGRRRPGGVPGRRRPRSLPQHLPVTGPVRRRPSGRFRHLVGGRHPAAVARRRWSRRDAGHHRWSRSRRDADLETELHLGAGGRGHGRAHHVAPRGVHRGRCSAGDGPGLAGAPGPLGLGESPGITADLVQTPGRSRAPTAWWPGWCRRTEPARHPGGAHR